MQRANQYPMDERDNHFERCTDLGVTMIWQQPLDVGRRATLCAQFFFYHISHFRCHFILSFQGNFCFYKYVSFTLQHCQQWNVTKSRTKVQRWFWLDQSVIMKRDKGHRLFYMAKTWLREQNTPNEIWNAINIWMRQDHWR